MRTRFLHLALLPLCAGAVTAVAPSDKTLYQDSIQATKQSIAQETLGAIYHDAVDYYNDQRYDESLQLLDKIYSINPRYENVASLRETIRRKQQNTQNEQTMDTVRSWMKKGDAAAAAGQKVLAISYWKQALQINPQYAPAKKKIAELNAALAKKEFEAGYIHYHHGENEDALESWSNAIALDPSYKDKGLLLLMSKIELQGKHDQVARLAAQGFDQYQQGMLEDALHTYQELSTLEPRHEEARRMAAKIKIQLGSAALKAAQTAMTKKAYPEVILQADKAIGYGYQETQARKLKTDAEQAIKVASQPKPHPKPDKKPPVTASTGPVTTQTTQAAPAQPGNPEEALLHYRRGLAAIRNKDYHLAIQELDSAAQLDPSNERVYIAKERAKQEWAASQSGASQ